MEVKKDKRIEKKISKVTFDTLSIYTLLYHFLSIIL